MKQPKKIYHRVLITLSLIFSGLVIFSSFTYASSTTYYISTTGNDTTGNGTSGTPWRTLSKACEVVTTPGDIIHVNAGTYTESSKCNLSVGVSIEGSGKDTTIVKSSITGQWSDVIELNSPQSTNGSQSVSNFTLDGQTNTSGNASGTWVGIWITGRSNVAIHDMKFTNFYDSATIFDGFDATFPMSDPGVTATGNSFYNNDGTNCAGIISEAGYSGSGCLMIGGQTGMEIHHNSLVTTARPALKNGWPIKYWDNGYLKGVKIYDNILTKAPYMATYWGEGGDWDFAVEFFNVSGMEFYNNTVQGAVDINYVYKGNYSYGLWAHHNTLNHATPNYSHPESGFIFEFKADTIIVENNTVNNAFVGISYNARSPQNTGGYSYPCGTGGCSANINNIIRNNVFSNIYQASYGLSGGVILQTENDSKDPYVSGLQIYNNTFVSKSTQQSPYGIDFTSQNHGTSAGISIKNNIFQGFSQGSVIATAAQTQNNIVITHNDGYNNDNNTPVWPGSGVTISNNLAINPLFVSTTDLHLQTTSPVIDRGINVGLAYNGSAPDIGYIESTSSGSGGSSGGGSGSGSGSGSGGSSGGSGGGGTASYCPTGTTGVYPDCVSTGQIDPLPLPPITNNPIYFIKPLKINIRSAKDTSSALVVTLYNRSLIEVLEGNQNSEWVKVKTSNGKIGYVRSKYTQQLVRVGDKASITEKVLNLRKGESFTSPSLKLLKPTDTIEVISLSPSTIWVKVKTTSGLVGFVNKFLLKVRS